jgi:hypothetical protein
LYNPSFSAENLYRAYIKLYLITESIKEWVDLYNSTGKDPATFNETDINNFLISTGFGNIANAPESEISLKLKRKIIENYSILMRTKGTNDAILKVMEIIESLGTDVKYQKYLITEFIENINDKTGDIVFYPISINDSNSTKDSFETFDVLKNLNKS